MPRLSVIVPAFNEEACLGETIDAIRDAMASVGFDDYELIVVDDASTDATPEIALKRRVKLVQCRVRNIAASRNSGAKEAVGEYLLFVDADTQMTPALARELIDALGNRNLVGGGARIGWNKPTRFWADFALASWNRIARVFQLAAGSFIFARREVFERIGGFDEDYFIGEELILSRKLKKHGGFVVLTSPALTSPRKAEQFSAYEHMRFLRRAMVSPRKTMQSRDHLDIWYTRR